MVITFVRFAGLKTKPLLPPVFEYIVDGALDSTVASTFDLNIAGNHVPVGPSRSVQ